MPTMRRQSQPERMQISASGLQIHKLSDLQLPQQKRNNQLNPLFIGQKMPKHDSYIRKYKRNTEY